MRGLIVIACLGLLLVAPAIVADEPRPSPLWSVDLKSFSYAARPIVAREDAGAHFQGIGLFFSQPGRLVCYFEVKTGIGPARRDSPQPSDPFQLEILSFEGSTGALEYQKQLPPRPPVNEIQPNDVGNFIVRTGDFLTLYDTDFNVLKQRKLIDSVWPEFSSPSRKTFVLSHYAPSQPLQVEVLDSESLSTLLRFEDPMTPSMFYSASDTKVAKLQGTPDKIHLRSFQGPWVIVPNSPSCMRGFTGFGVHFINDDQLLASCARDLEILDTKGTVLMRESVERNENVEETASVTPDGRFFAVSAMQKKGGFLDLTEIRRSLTRILVYDVVLRRRIASIPVDPIPQRDYAFAVSPDGSKVAVMTDHYLKVYAIAPQ